MVRSVEPGAPSVRLQGNTGILARTRATDCKSIGGCRWGLLRICFPSDGHRMKQHDWRAERIGRSRTSSATGLTPMAIPFEQRTRTGRRSSPPRKVSSSVVGKSCSPQ